MDGRASHPISKGEPGHPAEEAHFSRLYLPSCSFGHYLKLVSTGEGGGRRSTGKSRALPFGSPIRLSMSCSRILPSLMNETLRYLNSCTWGWMSSPNRGRHATFVWLRSTASDLEVLILLWAASHSAGANRTTSSAETRDLIPRSPDQDPLNAPAAPRNSFHKS